MTEENTESLSPIDYALILDIEQQIDYMESSDLIYIVNSRSDSPIFRVEKKLCVEPKVERMMTRSARMNKPADIKPNVAHSKKSSLKESTNIARKNLNHSKSQKRGATFKEIELSDKENADVKPKKKRKVKIKRELFLSYLFFFNFKN